MNMRSVVQMGAYSRCAGFVSFLRFIFYFFVDAVPRHVESIHRSISILKINGAEQVPKYRNNKHTQVFFDF